MAGSAGCARPGPGPPVGRDGAAGKTAAIRENRGCVVCARSFHLNKNIFQPSFRHKEGDTGHEPRGSLPLASPIASRHPAQQRVSPRGDRNPGSLNCRLHPRPLGRRRGCIRPGAFGALSTSRPFLTSRRKNVLNRSILSGVCEINARPVGEGEPPFSYSTTHGPPFRQVPRHPPSPGAQIEPCVLGAPCAWGARSKWPLLRPAKGRVAHRGRKWLLSV